MFYKFINVFLLFIALTFVLSKNKSSKPHQFVELILNNLTLKGKLLVSKTTHFSISFFGLILILFAFTFFTSVFQLGVVPYGMNVDEAGMAYDALSIVNYGVDRYLNPYPVYFINYGDGQNAMYTYLAAVLIKIFGYDIITVRLPAVLLRLVTFIAIYFIMKAEQPYEGGYVRTLLLLFLFTFCPYFIMQSRWGLESNLLVGFLTISICLFMYAIRNDSSRLFFLSGISFGLTLYTYALSYIIIPVFLLLTGLYLVVLKRIRVGQILLFSVPLVLLAMPLVLMILVNKGFIPEIRGVITIPLLQFYRGGEVSLGNIFHNFYIIIAMLSFDNPEIYGRQLFFNAIPYFGTVYYFSIPFFVVGILSTCKNAICGIKNKRFNNDLVFTIWFFSVLLCDFLIIYPNINKTNAVFVPVFYFIMQGIVETAKRWNNVKAVLTGVLVLYLFGFSTFSYYYFSRYNYDSKGLQLFATDYLDVVKYCKHLRHKQIQILDTISVQPYIYVLLENKISPYNFKKNNIKVVDNNFEKTYLFKDSTNLESLLSKSGNREEEKAYIVFNNTHWNNKFKENKLQKKEFGKICLFYE